MTTADRIKNRRIELGLTQIEVAKRLGLTSKAAVCKVEKQGDDVTLKNVERFSKVLDCSIAYLMGWADEDVNEEIKLSPNEERFIDMYHRLDAYQRGIVENMLTALTSQKEAGSVSQKEDS